MPLHALPPPRRLHRADKPAVLRHFLALPQEDRRLRFAGHLADVGVQSYVLNIDFDRDVMFGSPDDELVLIGVAHLSRGTQHAELGLSVLPTARNRGVGRSLLKRGYVHARNWGAPALVMHCLASNTAIMRLARDEGMEIVTESGEADAWLRLPPPDTSTYVDEVLAGCVSQFDHGLKVQRTAFGTLVQAFTGPARSAEST